MKIKKKSLFKKILLFCLVSFLLLLTGIFLCNYIIDRKASQLTFDNIQKTPYIKTGLLLGTGKYLANGNENPYYKYRIDAAVELIQAGRIKYLVISGDNSRKDYDEPSDMRADLIKRGIDSGIIYLDYAGFRTFDSVVRFGKIFGQDSALIISQKFHNERAIYLAHREGIYAIAYNARDLGKKSGKFVRNREILARVNVFTDLLLNTEPKFLGPEVMIP